MGLSTPAAARIAAGALLLSSILFLSPASAQVPPELASNALEIIITCEDNFLEPNWAGQDEVDCLLQDISRDAVYLPGATSGMGVTSHTISAPVFVPRDISAHAEGWKMEDTLGPRSLYGGDQIPFKVRAKATPLLNTQDYHFELVTEYQGPGGYNKTIRVPFTAEVQPYDFALVSWQGNPVQKAGQDEVVTYTLAVTNSGVYPDSYRFDIKPSSPELRVSVPPNLYVPPGETRTANISVLTPHGKLYEIGRSETLSIKVTSVTGTGVYYSTAVLGVRGAYLPPYWIPLVLVGLVSASVVARGSREKLEMRSLEKGRPRRVELTPRQAILLAELKRTDPEAYERKRRSLDAVYKERRADYRAHRKERLVADREEARQAKLEFIAAKKARKAKRAEEKRAAKLAKAQQKREAKAQRKAEKAEAKLVKKKEKALAKTRAKLEKQRAKAEAREAKLRRKEEAAAAKQAKKEAALQKRQQMLDKLRPKEPKNPQ